MNYNGYCNIALVFFFKGELVFKLFFCEQLPKGIQFVVFNLFSLRVLLLGLLLGYILFLKKILQTDFKIQMTIRKQTYRL